MNTFFKTLIVWIIVLAVPLQGFASTTMMLCAPAPPASAPSQQMNMPHDHQAMLAAQAAGGKSAAAAEHDATPRAHAASKCGASSACCFGVAMSPSTALVLSCEALTFETIPFDAGKTPSVDLAGPERPPQSLLV